MLSVGWSCSDCIWHIKWSECQAMWWLHSFQTTFNILLPIQVRLINSMHDLFFPESIPIRCKTRWLDAVFRIFWPGRAYIHEERFSQTHVQGIGFHHLQEQRRCWEISQWCSNNIHRHKTRSETVEVSIVLGENKRTIAIILHSSCLII